MSELADEADSKSVDGNIVRVQVPPPAYSESSPTGCFLSIQAALRCESDVRFLDGVVETVSLAPAPSRFKVPLLSEYTGGYCDMEPISVWVTLV